MWGEDAYLYLPEAIQDGPLANLFRGNGGYTHLPDRLVAAPVAFLPIEWAAPYFAVVATLVAAGGRRAHRIPRPSLDHVAVPMQAVLVMGIVLTPVAANDLTANVVNLVWVYVAALPFALASMEERTRDVIGRSLLAFPRSPAGSVVSVVFIPLAFGLGDLYRRTPSGHHRRDRVRRRADRPGRLLAVCGERDGHSPPKRSLADLTQLVEGRVFAAPLAGEHQASIWWQDHGQLFLL